jgi:cytochrome c oxidase subunit IV
MTTTTFHHGKQVDGFLEVHEHVSPASSYAKVLGALFVLTGLTYAVSYADLGSASLYVAMAVAFAKAALVCMYFMHLRYDDRYHVFVFLSTVIFVTIFFLFTLFDLQSRNRLNEEEATFFRIQQGDPYNDSLRAKKIVPAPAPAPEGKADAKAPAKAEPAKGH